MTRNSDAVALSPSILGQAEKTHNAFLFRVLDGTGVDEPQWITLQLALAAAAPVARGDLVQRVVDAAKYPPEVVHAAVTTLTSAARLSSDGDDLTVTDAGRDFVEGVRTKIGPVIARVYGEVPASDLETAGRVLTTLTAKLSAELDSL